MERLKVASVQGSIASVCPRDRWPAWPSRRWCPGFVFHTKQMLH